jgi:TonB-dependent starch-binding outer membrane protein SusC
MYLSALCKSRLRDYRNPLNNGVVTKTLLRSNKTIILAMKLTAILLLTACLQVSAKSYSQTVTLNMHNAPLEEVVKELKRQTKYNFFYEKTLFQNASPVTVSVSNKPFDQTLELCFKNQPFDYKIVGKTVFIRKKVTQITSQTYKDLLIDIRGRVVNDKGEPVSASITVKGSTKGTSTNNDGWFVLAGIDDNVTLIISGVGIETIEIKVDGKTLLEIAVKITAKPLDEVQMIAYGSTTKRFNTGSVSTVKNEDIEKHPVSNVLAALGGRVPGMFITQNTGMPGGSFTVQIRGKNSIAQGTNPLYIINGVPYISELLGNVNPAGSGNPLNFINPSDIESISVLKDADATAIYGSRAANGAVLINTKKGATGKTKLGVNVYSGIGKAPLRVDWLNTPQYLQMRHKALSDDGETPSTWNAPDLLLWDTTRYTDWQNLLIGGTAHYTDAQTNLSGGTENLQYLFGVGYHKESTVFPFDGADQKVSAHFNITNTSFDKKFKLTLSGNYLQDNSNLPSIDLAAFLNTPPNAPTIYNPDGTLNWENSTFFNPLSLTLQKYKARTNNLVSNAVLSYQLIKNLEVKSSFGYTNMQVNENQTTPISSQNPGWSPVGYSVFTNNSALSWIIEPQVNYRMNLGQHHIEALVGSTFQSNKNNGQIIYASGYTSDAMLESIQAAPTLQINSVTIVDYKYNALFGRLHYDYRNEWFLNLTMRRDGSSRFGANNQFNNFGAVGASWIFSKEDFLKAIPFLSFGKLRGSYGTTGNDQIPDYRFYNLFGSTPVSYQGTTGLIPFGLPNESLAWEETKKLEIGLDLGFVNDRFLLGANYYLNRSSNQLVPYNLPALAGFTSVIANLPAVVQNNGFEFSITAVNIKSKNFKWTSFLNLTVGRNKLVSYPDFSNSAYKNILIIGEPITARRAFHFIGVNDTTGVYQYSSIKGEPTYSPSFPDDATAIVNNAPKYYGAVENSFEYKGFTFDFMFQFRKQAGINGLVDIGPPGYYLNQPTTILNSSSQKFTQSFGSATQTAYGYARQSDLYYVDASYIRLSNVSISYTFPSKWTRKMHLSNGRIYMRGQNLLTLTKYKGMDPENQSFTALPPLRVVTAGIQFSL